MTSPGLITPTDIPWLKIAIAAAIVIAGVVAAIVIDWRALIGLLTLGVLKAADRRRDARQKATEADKQHRARSEARNARVEALGRSRARSEADADARVPAEDPEPLSEAERARRLEALRRGW